jgi:hypothetical protein
VNGDRAQQESGPPLSAPKIGKAKSLGRSDDNGGGLPLAVAAASTNERHDIAEVVPGPQRNRLIARDLPQADTPELDDGRRRSKRRAHLFRS